MQSKLHSLSLDSLDLWLGRSTPRYTSYPPASFFHGGLSADDYERSLAALPKHQPLSLYVHIPFCHSLCLYCGCNTMITHRAERMNLYVKALKLEIKKISSLTGRHAISHLHFGGGTPNILSEATLHDLFLCLRDHFDLNAAQEIAVELDPRLVKPDQVKTLAALGVTRVSLGVQDFNPDVQKAVHRLQPFEMVESVCDALRSAGIVRLNFDLMYGLPYQTAHSLAYTAEQALSLKPNRFALFSYAHVPQMKKHQKVLEELGLPDDHRRLAQERVVRNILMSQGYHAIGIDHFAIEGDTMYQAFQAMRLHRNFQGYTDDATETIIGLGASSITQTYDGYFQNAHDEETYQDNLRNGRLSVQRGVLLTQDDRVRRAIIEQLMCYMSCDIEAVCQNYDYSLDNFTMAFDQLRPFELAGIVERNNKTLFLTTPHRMAVRAICMLFDDYSRHTSDTVTSRTA